MTDTLFDLEPTAPQLERVSPMPTFLEGGHPVEVDMAVSAEWGNALAVFSPGRAHRYLLSRIWDPARPMVAFVMLNPSTADAFKVDPTVRRCLGFARAWGGGGLLVLNIFALRATDPRVMRAHPDPIGAHNDEALRALADVDCARVVAAWGAHGAHLNRGARVRSMLADAGVDLDALVRTKDGHPGHPLYVAADTQPFPLAA